MSGLYRNTPGLSIGTGLFIGGSGLWDGGSGLAPGPPLEFNVLDSDGNSFAAPAYGVLDSDGNSFKVSKTVLDSDGNSFAAA